MEAVKVIMRHNVLPLAAVRDFRKRNCQPSTNFDRSTALDLNTSAPIGANGCFAVRCFSVVLKYIIIQTNNTCQFHQILE
jgi:hypothetical protein